MVCPVNSVTLSGKSGVSSGWWKPIVICGTLYWYASGDGCYDRQNGYTGGLSSLVNSLLRSFEESDSMSSKVAASLSDTPEEVSLCIANSL